MNEEIIVPVEPRNMFSLPKLQLYCVRSYLLFSRDAVDIIKCSAEFLMGK